MQNITILVTTTQRPQALKRILGSISLYYPKIPVIVFDDTDSDIGVSAARNKLIREAKTEYVFIVEDDCIFTNDTRLDILKKNIGDNDMIGLRIIQNGTELVYRGNFEYKDGRVTYCSGEPLEFIPNIFLAKRKSLLKFPYDESLKIGEHFAFFFENRGKLKIGHCENASILHEHMNNPKYNVIRNRAIGYVKKYMKKAGIKERVDLNGELIVA